MRNLNTRRKAKEPQLRTLTIEVLEDVAVQLEKSVGTRARYGSIGDVAARVVEEFYPLLVESERAQEAFVEQQYRKVRKSGFRIVGK